MRVPRVYNLESPRTGNRVANQYVIEITRLFPSGRKRKVQVFQSYDSRIAVIKDEWGAGETIHEEILDRDYWDYSATTLKYLKQFLVITDSKAQIQKDIKDGKYKLANLNQEEI